MAPKRTTPRRSGRVSAKVSSASSKVQSGSDDMFFDSSQNTVVGSDEAVAYVNSPCIYSNSDDSDDTGTTSSRKRRNDRDAHTHIQAHTHTHTQANTPTPKKRGSKITHTYSENENLQVKRNSSRGRPSAKSKTQITHNEMDMLNTHNTHIHTHTHTQRQLQNLSERLMDDTHSHTNNNIPNLMNDLETPDMDIHTRDTHIHHTHTLPRDMHTHTRDTYTFEDDTHTQDVVVKKQVDTPTKGRGRRTHTYTRTHKDGLKTNSHPHTHTHSNINDSCIKDEMLQCEEMENQNINSDDIDTHVHTYTHTYNKSGEVSKKKHNMNLNTNLDTEINNNKQNNTHTHTHTDLNLLANSNSHTDSNLNTHTQDSHTQNPHAHTHIHNPNNEHVRNSMQKTFVTKEALSEMPWMNQPRKSYIKDTATHTHSHTETHIQQPLATTVIKKTIHTEKTVLHNNGDKKRIRNDNEEVDKYTNNYNANKLTYTDAQDSYMPMCESNNNKHIHTNSNTHTHTQNQNEENISASHTLRNVKRRKRFESEDTATDESHTNIDTDTDTEPIQNNTHTQDAKQVKMNDGLSSYFLEALKFLGRSICDIVSRESGSCQQDLASETVGGKIIFASDEFSGAGRRLLSKTNPCGTLFSHQPDAWETRPMISNKTPPAMEFLIIKLGQPGNIKSFKIDTSYCGVTKSNPLSISIEGAYFTDDRIEQGLRLLPRSVATNLGIVGTWQAPEIIQSVESMMDEQTALQKSQWEDILPLTTITSSEVVTCDTTTAIANRLISHARVNVFKLQNDNDTQDNKAPTSSKLARLRFIGKPEKTHTNNDASTEDTFVDAQTHPHKTISPKRSSCLNRLLNRSNDNVASMSDSNSNFIKQEFRPTGF